MQVPDINTLQDKIHADLSKHGWYQYYRFYDWRPALEKLGDKFCPRFKYLVEFFSMCRPENLKMAVLESFAVSAYPTDEYRLPYDDCRSKILDTCGMTIDQKNWNGVLVIPVALTNWENKLSYHRDIWESFIAYTLDIISRMQDIQWILSGPPAWEWESYINVGHTVYKHHSPVTRKWACRGDIFKMIENQRIIYSG